jgi:hypothetical protein
MPTERSPRFQSWVCGKASRGTEALGKATPEWQNAPPVGRKTRLEGVLLAGFPKSLCKLLKLHWDRNEAEEQPLALPMHFPHGAFLNPYPEVYPFTKQELQWTVNPQ